MMKLERFGDLRRWVGTFSEDRGGRSRGRRNATRSQFTHAETLEVRLLLAGTYGYDIIGNGAIDAASVSVNDSGDTVYMDTKQAFVGDGLTGPTVVNAAPVSPFLIPNPGLQINNAGRVGETNDGVGAGNPAGNIWDGIAAPNIGTTIVRGVTTQHFTGVGPSSSLTNDGKLAFAAGSAAIGWEVHLSDTLIQTVSPTTLVTKFPLGTNFNIMAGDGDRIVIGSDANGDEQVELYDITGTNSSTLIASTASPVWDDVGLRPGISDDGEVVVFYGDLSLTGALNLGLPQGPGIFASVPTGGALGSRLLIRVGENLGDTAGGATIEFDSFVPDSRVNVVRQAYGPYGLDDDALIVSFVATPDSASPAGAANDPLVFTANAAIWSNRIDISDVVAGEFTAARALRVIQVGDPLSADFVTSVSIHDSLATPVESPNGQPMLPRRGDHYLAFQAVTGIDTLAVRANFLNDNANAAAVPPRLSQFTGPILLTGDLRPTVTWAGLPHVDIDYWELLGYHQLSGREVVNEQIASDQLAFRLPATAALGTHEFWLRGHNAAGAEAWTIPHRFYFHVVAPVTNPSTVQITGPISSVHDDTPFLSWAEFPNTATYDALVYSTSRGVEVARFEAYAGTAFELPQLSTQDTYSVYMRANTNFAGTTAWSRPSVFTVGLSAPPLQTPTNITPTGSTNNTQPQFTWTGVPAAFDYEVILTSSVDGVVARDIVEDPTYTPPTPLPTRPYVISIRARNDAMEFGPWQDEDVFIVPIIVANDPDTTTNNSQDIETIPSEPETYPVVVYRPETMPALSQSTPMRAAVSPSETHMAQPEPAEYLDAVFVEWPETEPVLAETNSGDDNTATASVAGVAALLLANETSRRQRKRRRHR